MTSQAPAGRPDPMPPVVGPTPAAGGVIVIDEYGTAISCQCGAYKQPFDPCPRCNR